MDIVAQVLFIEIPVLLVAGLATASLVWWYREGAIRQVVEESRVVGIRTLCVVAVVGVWIAATVVSWWCLFLPAYVALLSMYILFGNVGGWLALVSITMVSAAVPIAWGGILFGLARREFGSAHGSPRIAAPPRIQMLLHR